MKIKIIQPVSDRNDQSKMYEVGTELDLGAERNKAAVNKRVAVWVDNKSNEKVSIPTDKKKKVSKAGSVIIETKKSE
ncbi:hypothetical protein SAMN05421866_3491 [Chryseobacterium oranimense]|uniref:Uncharacterized protein n=1 Tax=Chryseobacterium oranimense TaxID=421058 RepID=A0A1M5V106_9FLAO|nr:hypothetical protein [Chryseobacterium oranimense]SHH68935.1 hypothetical protein SAMN05421866_3491 [Chryseobacterium oranimense]